ncbi:hypothetical protein [Streptomyces niveus]|uniref:hypothetical protein n=1 Tax=Streptomyces niveus TaxID=193462 RepID=UPI00341B97B5
MEDSAPEDRRQRDSGHARDDDQVVREDSGHVPQGQQRGRCGEQLLAVRSIHQSPTQVGECAVGGQREQVQFAHEDRSHRVGLQR